MAVSDSGPFEFIVPGAPCAFEVASFRGRERMGKPYRFDILLLGPEVDVETVDSEYVGRAAHLRFGQSGDDERWVHGIIRRMEARGVSAERAGERTHAYRVRLSPRLWLLGRNQDSRIFQDQSVPEIVRAVLREGGVRSRFRFSRVYPPRTYCVQYQESDLDFVERLLAEEGIFHFFEQPPGEEEAEILVVTDDAGLCQPIAGSSTLTFHDSGGLTEREDAVRRFRLRRRVEPGSILLREFDFLRPSFDLSQSASVGDVPDPLGGLEQVLAGTDPRAMQDVALGAVRSAPMGRGDARGLARQGEQAAAGAAHGALSAIPGGAREAVQAGVSAFADSLLGAAGEFLSGLINEPVGAERADATEIYDHHGEFEPNPIRERSARMQLEQKRRRVWVGLGEGRCHRLAPGHRFELQGAAIASHDGEYLLFQVEHAGNNPRYATDGARSEVYRASFQCVPARTSFRPRRPAHRVQQVMETATVVGPAGHEIHTDTHGRIKVQFHWDRQGRRNERSSCWMRVMQAWAGAGWGFQFIPRIGMEVLVTFVGGDVDRPMVIGSAYNAEHPVPFPLPQSKTKSGIRTQTSRGGGGFNELSFEDRAGHERFYQHAQKDHEIVVLHDQTTRVGNNRTEQVTANRYTVVSGNNLTSVAGDVTQSVGGSESRAVGGNRSWTVTGNTNDLVRGSSTVSVAEDHHAHVGGQDRREVEGATHRLFRGDATETHHGNATLMVGRHDQKRAYVLHVEGVTELSSTGTTEVSAEEGVVIRCGQSSIRLTPERIDLIAPTVAFQAGGVRMSLGSDKLKVKANSKIALLSDDKIILKSSGASLSLQDEAKLDGSKVRLKTPDSDSDSSDEQSQVTTIELKDDQGNPLPYQRYVIVLEGGEERSGVLDAEGRAELELEGSASIVFPELASVEAG